MAQYIALLFARAVFRVSRRLSRAISQAGARGARAECGPQRSGAASESGGAKQSRRTPKPTRSRAHITYYLIML